MYERYGPPEVLELAQVDMPSVEEDGVLIRVRAASVNRSDWEALSGRPAFVRFSGAGFWRPKNPILGSDVAGIVERVGSRVTRFRPGDEVFGDALYFGAGTFAEYAVLPERAPLALKPPGLSFVDAATLPQAAVLALQGLRDKGQVEPGQRVLINGAGGGGGSFAVQIAASLGAEVTGVDSGAKLDAIRSLGAAHVVDFARQNYTRLGNRYDRILDFVGVRSIFTKKRALGSSGVYLVVGASVPRLLEAAVVGGLMSKMGTATLGVLIARPNRDDLAEVGRLAESGTITPLVEKQYPLDAVPDALRHLGEGRAIGKLVITM